jgi:hypothetical protein
MLNKTKLGKKNKRKGSNAERLYAKIFRELGYTHCKTSRYGSKLHDSAGIDLIFIPFNVQIKAGYSRGLNYSKELKYLEDRMKELFPTDSIEHSLPKLLIHHKDKKKGSRSRAEYDDLVVLTFKDFKKILKKIK